MSTCIPKNQLAQLKERVQNGEITPEQVAKMLPEEKIALKLILEDYVAEKLGINVSKGEVQAIQEKAKVIDTAQQKLGGDLGNPDKVQEHIDFFKAKKDMVDYLFSRHPANRLKILTGTVGRGMMLASVKSPLLNIGTNAEAFSEALVRRLTTLQFRGTDNKLAVDYVKLVNKVYQKTGYDMSRMLTLSDNGMSGERVLGETVHSQGPGLIRKAGRLVEDVVFKQLMGAPDVAFASTHFADSVNLNSKKYGARAKEVMKDSMLLEPKTPEGELLRARGVLDAQKATWTDDTWASKVSTGIRKVLNDVSGDLRAGDYLLPFVKTPANIIATGMDYAGMGIPKALFKTYKAFKTGDFGSKAHVQSMAGDIVRSGLGLTGALIIANTLNNNDFVGAYDPSRAQIEQLRNSNYNAFRVNGKWISTDWLGPLMVPFTAIMYARKYGSTPGERTFQYGKGVLASALNIPGVSDIFDYVKSNAFKKNQTLEQMTGATADYISSQLYSRLVPSFLSDIAKAIDPSVRQSNSGLQSVIAKIPFLSKTLPEKRNIFGETIKTESGLSTILFGSRVKTDAETSLIKEIDRVSKSVDKGVSFTNWDKSSSDRLAQFKQKVGDARYNDAKLRYGAELKKQLSIAVNAPAYKRLSDDQKLTILNNQDAQALEKIFNQYNFKYKVKKKESLPKL